MEVRSWDYDDEVWLRITKGGHSYPKFSLKLVLEKESAKNLLEKLKKSVED